MDPLLIEFRHGLGDLVQLTVVLRHLWRKWPGRPIHVSTFRQWQGLIEGLVTTQTDYKDPPRHDCEFIRLDWPECTKCYAEHPSTKAERCLLDTFNIAPRIELCGYLLAPSPAAFAAAERWTARCPGPYALVHYQGHSSRAKKDMPEKIIAEACEVLCAAGVTPLVFDARRESTLRADWLVRELPPPLVTAALATRSRLNLGIDSGPGHIFGSVPAPAVISWYEHHPLHFYEPTPHVLHIVPEDHHGLLRAAGQPAEACKFFESHYRHLPLGREVLPEIVEKHLRPRPLTSTVYEREYYEQHRADGLDYGVYGDWQKSYGAWLVDCLDLRGKLVLEAGCACGSIALGMERAGARVTGVDVSQHMIAVGRQQWPELELLVRDLSDLSGIRDESFDAVHSSQSAEHWEPSKVPAILSELRRVLKPGGIFWCSLDTVELFARQNRQDEALMLAGDPTHLCVQPMAWWQAQRDALGFVDVTDEVRPRLECHPCSFLRRYDWDWFCWQKPAA